MAGRDLTQTTLASWRRQITKEFEAALDRHIANIHRRAAELGLITTRAAADAAETDAEARRFRWFVRFHFLNETAAMIAGSGPAARPDGRKARNEFVSPDAVSTAVRAVAEAARIKLRSEGRRGRPRKSKSARN